jgi:hypothetical protein
VNECPVRRRKKKKSTKHSHQNEQLGLRQKAAPKLQQHNLVAAISDHGMMRKKTAKRMTWQRRMRKKKMRKMKKKTRMTTPLVPIDDLEKSDEQTCSSMSKPKSMKMKKS